MKCARCGAEVTNKIIKINGVIYCENCVKELGYDRDQQTHNLYNIELI